MKIPRTMWEVMRGYPTGPCEVVCLLGYMYKAEAGRTMRRIVGARDRRVYWIRRVGKEYPMTPYRMKQP